MNRCWFWPPILFISAIGAGVSALALPGTTLCLIVALWFLLVCPGMVIVLYLELEDVVAEWTLAIALSLAIDGIVAAVALYAGIWRPLGILWALIAFCIIGALLRIFSRPAIGSTNRWYIRRWSFLLIPLLILVALSAWIVPWSYNLYTQAAGTNSTFQQEVSQSASSTTRHSLSHTAKSITPVDVVIVMDNVDQIATYDPQSKRFQAAQLLVNMISSGNEVGIVRITSTDKPVPVLPLQALHTREDRDRVNNLLTENSFGPVDTTPVAYFTPALEMAGNMLISSPASHRKVILIFTDALAFSGDQNACMGSPDAYHHWFCEIKSLNQQGIVVSLLGFTTADNEAILRPVQRFFKAQGGLTLPVIDIDNLPAQLSGAYRTVLKQV